MVPVSGGVAALDEREDFDRLVDATSQARERAAAAIRRSARLMAVATLVCEEARTRCLASRAHRRYASLAGEVDGQPVRAVVRTDGTLVADTSLRQRADLLVRLGETFEGGLPANVSGPPLATALTLIRACDWVAELEVTFPTGVRAAAS